MVCLLFLTKSAGIIIFNTVKNKGAFRERKR